MAVRHGTPKFRRRNILAKIKYDRKQVLSQESIMTDSLNLESANLVYNGQFGEFSITQDDRQGVRIYRGALLVAALCVGLGTLATLNSPVIPFAALTVLYVGFSIALGVALMMIHIYMKFLHRALQLCWAIGSVVAVGCAVIAYPHQQSLMLYVSQHPLSILGLGFTFVALNGIFFKEAFCFNRLETKLLVAIVPSLLLGHLLGWLPLDWEKSLLTAWAVFFLIFALRKCFQNIPDDIGDKSVFEYLEKQAKTPGGNHGTAA
jgi:uncharacterized integral membrane protein